jgi:Inner membrane protein YgaP-like, transmembrane domain
MCNEAIIRRFAGTFILISLGLGWWVHPAWFLFTAFVGVNLIQSSISGFCPLERILGRLGWFGCRAAV